MITLIKKLAEIQKKLNAPKGQFNSFGKYHYRSCEDILMAVKPLLDGLALTVNDEIIEVAGRIYVKATATITDGESSISTSAFAREAETKKGMDDAQVTGSTSSYARKYALNGLLLIDDNKDADHADNREKKGGSEQVKLTESAVADFIVSIMDAGTMDDLKKAFVTAHRAAEHVADAEAQVRFEQVKDKRKTALQVEITGQAQEQS
jgi:hypothetical protein